MRKAFTLVLLALAIMIVGVSCDDTNHEHSYDATKWESDDTSHWHVCTICGAKSEVTAHTNTEERVKEPNCFETGSKEITCSVCGRKVTEEIKALEHDFSGEGGKCKGCGNTEADVNAAVARVGLKCYTKFEEAVHDAVKSDKAAEKTVEVMAKEITLTQAHNPELNGSVTINANGCDFKGINDISVYTYKTNSSYKDETSKEVNIVINNAKNLYVWGNGAEIGAEQTVNLELNGCEYDNESSGLVLIKGGAAFTTFGSITLTVKDCKIGTVKSDGITADCAKSVTVKDTTFTNTVLGINISNDLTTGCEVTISGCTFTNCGKDETFNENDANYPNGYSAPIRLKNSVDGTMTATLEGNTFSGTVSTKLGDVMLVDSRKNKTVHPITATFKDNSALNVTVYGKAASEEASQYKIESLEANVTKTIKQTNDNYSIE